MSHKHPEKSDKSVYKNSTEKWNPSIQPPLGWTTTVEELRVTDGDTVNFKIIREFNGRLIDFDAAETYRPKSQQEKEHGLKATARLQELYDNRESKPVVFVPASNDGQIKDIFSIGARAEIHLYIDGVNMGIQLDTEGYTKKTTEEYGSNETR